MRKSSFTEIEVATRNRGGRRRKRAPNRGFAQGRVKKSKNGGEEMSRAAKLTWSENENDKLKRLLEDMTPDKLALLKHCFDLKPGYGHSLRYLRAPRAAIT